MSLPSIRVGDRVLFQGKKWPVLRVRQRGPLLEVMIQQGKWVPQVQVKELER